jgi:hypothetical protein
MASFFSTNHTYIATISGLAAHGSQITTALTAAQYHTTAGFSSISQTVISVFQRRLSAARG